MEVIIVLAIVMSFGFGYGMGWLKRDGDEIKRQINEAHASLMRGLK